MIDLARVKNTDRWQGPVRTLETFAEFPLTPVSRPGYWDMIVCGRCTKKVFDVERDGDDHSRFNLAVLSRAVSDHAIQCERTAEP